MSPKIKEAICRYGFGVAITLAITWLRVLMAETLEDRVPFGLHYISILTTAWLCGTGPACVALLLGLVLSTYSPNSSFELHNPGDLLSLALYSIVGVVAIGLIRRSEREHDQSQRKATECEAMSTELAAADRRKDEFLALLAHELRNPLATLVSGVEAVDRSNADAEKRSAVLDSMRRQLRQLVVLVDDLLDVSRYLRGSLSLVREPTDLRDVIDAAIEVARPLIEHKQHELCFTRPLVPLAVDADVVRLTQVVVNLLTNAAKYTPKRGRIHVLCETTDERTLLHVVDNGIGISADSHRGIFELFTQVNSTATRDGEGLGIGLALVKQLVERHDGQVRVVSEGPGRGSRFTVELPKIDNARLRPSDPPQADGAPAAPESTGKRLLVIDDNADAAQTLAALLELDGYDATIAYDGHSGIRLAGEIRPDTILLDIGMPGLDGYEVARQIRASALTPSPRIIAVSGWGSDLDRRRSKEAGFDAHLTKPVQFDQLTAAITHGEPAPEAGASC